MVQWYDMSLPRMRPGFDSRLVHTNFFGFKGRKYKVGDNTEFYFCWTPLLSSSLLFSLFSLFSSLLFDLFYFYFILFYFIYLFSSCIISGNEGYRSPCLSYAKRTLYHLSYIPINIDKKNKYSGLRYIFIYFFSFFFLSFFLFLFIFIFLSFYLI